MKLADWSAALVNGDVDHRWALLRIEQDGHVLELEVSADAAKVRGVREAISARDQQLLADELGAVLLTARLHEERWRAASVRLLPSPSDVVKTTAAQHSARVDAAIAAAAQTVSATTIFADVGKTWILDAKGTATHAVNHGWLVPSVATAPTPRGATWRGIPVQLCQGIVGAHCIQNRGAVHGLDHEDYSQVALFAREACVLDGHPTTLSSIYQDQRLCRLVTHDGRPVPARQPGVPRIDSRLPSGAQGKALPGASDGAVASQPEPHAQGGPGGLPTLLMGQLVPEAERAAYVAAVKRWQAIVGAKVDGDYGPATTALTVAWQKAHPPLKADGAVGPKTWAKALGTELGAAPAPPPTPPGTGPQRLPAVRTKATPSQVYEALCAAWPAVIGGTPRRESVLLLVAQWAHETAAGAAMWCWNMGNAKAKPGGTRSWTFFACNEWLPAGEAARLVAAAKPRTDGKDGPDAVITKRREDGSCLVWFYPSHSACSFRAFLTLEAGALDYLALMRQRFASAWPAVEAGDPRQFAHLLKVARYYTDTEERYARALEARVAEMRGSVPA